MEEPSVLIVEAKKDEPKVGKIGSFSMSSWIKKLEWQDLVAITITLIVFVFFFNLANSFVHVPSPVFGGDYYRDRGFVKNIVEGNPIWSDGFYVNEIQYYPYLIFVLQAGIVQLTGLDVDTVFIFFPLLIVLLGALVWYLLGTALFKNKTGGLLVLSSLFGITYFFGLKSSDVGLFVLVPLFLFFWLRYEQTKLGKFSIWCGIVLGTIALVHGGRFLGSIFLFAISIMILFIIEIVKTKENREKMILIKEFFLKYYLIFVIAIAISLIFFLPLYLKYQLHSVNNVTVWGDTNIEQLGLSWIWAIFKQMFFNTSKVTLFLTSFISLIGLAVLLLTKKSFEQKWLLVICGANLIALEHHLLTRPLFNTYFNPGKLELITFLAPLFFAFGALFITQNIEKWLNKKIIIGAILVLLLTPNFYIQLKDYQGSQWIKYGQQESEYVDSLYQLADYITANVNKNETILSNDESGFMLATLSGRKVVLTRRTHANYYVDIDLRIAEATASMYGNNLTFSKQFLKKYNVKYLYLDQNLFTYSMRVRTDLKSLLQQNQVNFSEVYDRYDIALPLDQTNGMDLLLIPPQKLNPKFLELWEKAYQVKVETQIVGELYRLKEN